MAQATFSCPFGPIHLESTPLRFRLSAKTAFVPLLLLFPANPLRWASPGAARDWAKRPRGTAQDGHFSAHIRPPYPLWPFGSSPPDRGSRPRTLVTGVIPWVGQNISGAQNLSGWSKFQPGHWALGLQKLGPGAVPKRRLGFLSQRSRCVFTVGAAFGRPRARTARPYTGIAKDGTLGCPKHRSTSVQPLRKTGGVLVIL